MKTNVGLVPRRLSTTDRAMRLSTTSRSRYRDNARARMRTLVKRILKKCGYPPDLQDGAVRTVIEQAERILSEIAPTLQ